MALQGEYAVYRSNTVWSTIEDRGEAFDAQQKKREGRNEPRLIDGI